MSLVSKKKQVFLKRPPIPGNIILFGLKMFITDPDESIQPPFDTVSIHHSQHDCLVVWLRPIQFTLIQIYLLF